jgi:protein-tyrosine phosphatase
MAEFIMKHMIEERGLQEVIEVASAGTSREEIGNPVYPPARKELAKHGIGCDGHHARQMTREDGACYDYIVGMEKMNISYMQRILGPEYSNRIHLLMDFTGHPEDIDDPWYTGDFAGVYRQIEEGCSALLEQLV